jgi:hypothetical protein
MLAQRNIPFWSERAVAHQAFDHIVKLFGRCAVDARTQALVDDLVGIVCTIKIVPGIDSS